MDGFYVAKIYVDIRDGLYAVTKYVETTDGLYVVRDICWTNG